MIIPENYFIYISVFIVAIYIVMIIIGYHKGFLYELVNLIYTAASVLIAWFASPIFAKMFPLIDASKFSDEAKLLTSLFNLNEIINTVAYFLIIFLLLKLFYVFLALLIKSLNKIPVIGSINKYLGALSGIVNATIITLCISMLLSLPLFRNGNQVKDQTILKYVNKYSETALTFIAEKAGEANIKDKTDEFDIEKYREEFRQWLLSLSENE